WAVGLREPDARAFRDVPMSTSRTGARQAARLRALGLDVAALPTLVDLDTVADLPAVTSSGSAIRTAARARTLGVPPLPVAV
ncbi:MAG: glycosyltransferase, partial [Actinomycetota bacterium]|nr:glycosyltransferase [Actinomycetota bacterium]